ncbi:MULTISPECIES: HD-GYP domain-containing protein [Bacillus]|uniref:HD-GYP domain-containing protein n=1 Tax=Bacillus TaxID=1386 RepID=UPI0002DF9B3E|nr:MULTISPECIES: HD-GYP domain-containing protein [Bacillus]
MPINNEKPYKRELIPLTLDEIDQLLIDFKDIEVDVSTEKTSRYYDNYINPKVKIEEISKKVEEASGQISEMFQYIKSNDEVPIKEIQNDIIPIINEATEIPHVFHLFETLHKKDEYTYRHNICVGVISGLIGKWLGLNEEVLREVELAGLLHDIGKTKVPTQILQKASKLTETEYKKMKQHTIYGYELLKKTPNLSESIAVTALQHHEREDGMGYPFRLKGSQIHPYAKIVAVADVFHAMSSDRVYRKATPFYQVIKEMNNNVYGKFDPNILVVFLRRIMETLVGKQVRLTDGRIGNIIMNHPYNPVYSIVQLENKEFIDLRNEMDVRIEKVFRM